MTNEKLVLEAMTEWCNQWTCEMLEKEVFPHIEKFLSNDICVMQLLKWYEAKQANVKSRLFWIEVELKVALKKNGFDTHWSAPYRRENQDKYNDVIYDIFKSYNAKEEK